MNKEYLNSESLRINMMDSDQLQEYIDVVEGEIEDNKDKDYSSGLWLGFLKGKAKSRMDELNKWRGYGFEAGRLLKSIS